MRDKWVSRKKKITFIPNNSSWHYIRLRNPSGISAYGTRVYLDGEEIPRVQYVNFHLGVDDMIPKAEIGVIVRPDTVFGCQEINIVDAMKENDGNFRHDK